MATIKSSIKVLSVREFISLPLKIFSIVGIKIFRLDDSDVMTTKDKFYLAASALHYCICFSFLINAIFVVLEDTFQLLEWTLLLCFALIGVFKMFSVIAGRKTLNRALKVLDGLLPCDLTELHNFGLDQGFDYVMYHANIMYKSHGAVASMFVIFPFVQSCVEYLRTNLFIPRMPYIMSYPIDTNYTLGYTIVYISQIISGSTTSFFFLGSDLLLIVTIYMVVLQFKYLCYRIENFVPSNYDQDMSELKDILETHHLLNTLAEDVNNVFDISILLNYSASIIFIVLISLKIVFGSELLQFVKFFGFFLSSSIQIFYICMFGTQLLENSALVGEAFASQKWYMTDLRYQRMLILGIARSQRPAHLTAYKFFTISMETFSNLMTTAYQFFTLLKTRIEEN